MKNKLLKLLTVVLSVCVLLSLATACVKDNDFNSGDTILHEHKYSSEVISPTCTEKGYTIFTCECGDTYNDEEVDALGHSFTNFVDDNNSTYVKNGTKTAKCDNGCSAVDVEENVGSQKIFAYEEINIPILKFTGDISTMSKENEVLLGVEYENEDGILECDATLKWQGASSLSYPKKNYTMKLLKKGTDKKLKVEMKDGWGEQNKYCLKANYIDFSHARNVVSGKIYGEIVKSRELNDEVERLVNGGAVDGFPILIYINGNYQGLYTLNIPKDKWMFGMEDDDPDTNEVTKQALLMADSWCDEVWIKKEIEGTFEESGFELEFCSTEDTIGDSWVKESFNQMIEFVNNNDGQDFKNGISNYVNVERVIDSMLLTCLIGGTDNVAKNIIWATYDGVHWYSSMYDMDSTLGIYWTGEKIDLYQDFWNNSYINQLWLKLLDNYYDEIKDRYQELRQGILSENNLAGQLLTFSSSIPDCVRECEKEKWKDIPSFDHSSSEYMFAYIKKSLAVIDEYFDK